MTGSLEPYRYRAVSLVLFNGPLQLLERNHVNHCNVCNVMFYVYTKRFNDELGLLCLQFSSCWSDASLALDERVC